MIGRRASRSERDLRHAEVLATAGRRLEAVDPSMSRHRLAIEAWCCAPSRYPMAQLPIVL